MNQQRTKIMNQMIETFTSPVGVGSDLVDLKYVDLGYMGADPRIEVDRGNGGTIDLDHLVSEIEILISEAIDHDRETR